VRLHKPGTLATYRSFGEVVNASWDNALGVLKFGIWHDYQRTGRYQRAIDYTLGGVADYNPTANPDTQYLFRQNVYNYVDQYFGEYDLRLSKDLTVNVGVKEVRFERKYEAPINQTTLTQLNYTQKQNKALGSASINYSLQNEWTVYAQAAQGFLAPNQNQLYVPNPALNRPKAQETMNYQVGTVYKKERLNGAFDLYQIDYKNYPYSYNDATLGQTITVMADGAKFSGAEAEVTFLLGGGFSLYANGSINNAKFKTSDVDVNLVPSTTGALGAEYEGHGFFTSVMDKYVGYQKIYAPTGFNPNDATTITTRGRSGGYSMINFTIGYGVKFSQSFLRSVKIKLEINNVMDRKVQILDSYSTGGFGIPTTSLGGYGAVSATAAAGGLPTQLFAVLPTRNYFLTISGEF
jgi:iron complex outermembrane receptor protein